LDREDFLKTSGAACQRAGSRSTLNRRRRPSSQRGSKGSAGEKENLALDARATSEGGACQGDALPNYDELQMDCPTLGNGIMDACFQIFFANNASLCVNSED
jgi:hypothetical protein